MPQKEIAIKAIVVYESFWGNTAAVARAIAEGIGPQAQVMNLTEATPAAIAGADLIVVGAPIVAFSLPSDQMREALRNERQAPRPPDLSHPSMRSWLDALPKATGRAAAFETGIWWSPGGSKGAITQALERAGYQSLAKPQRFLVKGRYGPLKEGELEKAKLWGTELAKAMQAAPVA